jgi:hypothetical protein
MICKKVYCNNNKKANLLHKTQIFHFLLKQKGEETRVPSPFSKNLIDTDYFSPRLILSRTRYVISDLPSE